MKKELNCFKRPIGRILLAVLLVLSMAMPFTVFASSDDSSTGSSAFSTPKSVEDTAYRWLDGSYLSSGTVKLSVLDTDEVALTGVTHCAHAAPTVYLTMSLERKDGDTYSTYKMWNFSDTNATVVARGINVIVPSGYYYRLRGYHAAVANGVRESIVTLTDGIWVGDPDDEPE